MLAIILPAILAGIVAILVTLAIERFGGLVGGVLGTIPSTIIPAAAGVYHIDGKEGLLSSMSIVPLAMMVNGLFLSVWIILPKYVSAKKNPLLLTTIASLLTWAFFAYIALSIADYSVSIDISPAMFGILGTRHEHMACRHFGPGQISGNLEIWPIGNAHVLNSYHLAK